jgi:Ala-tRNA(Pro) deacylase
MDICDFLHENGITYERYDHEPVFTCEQADRLDIPDGSAKTKNLFLKDRKGRRHILVTVGAAKSVDIKALEALLDAKGLSFASPERLERYLGLSPGSVTILGVINDPQGLVEVVVDEDLLAYPAMQCHPLTNTSTLVVSMEDVMRFLSVTGHTPRVLVVPGRVADG